MPSIRRFIDRLRAKAAAKHRSAWDNPTTGTDLLAAMVTTKRRKENPLP